MAWALVRNRLSISTLTGKGAYRSVKVWKCWLANSVVGTSTAAWNPVLDRLEHGPDGHLGLAEPDVATDQPVHGQGPLHVRLHLLDGPQLVGRLDEGERRLELGLPRACPDRRRAR